MKSFILGDLVGVIGSSWSLHYPLTTIEWFSPSGISNIEKADAIRSALEEDLPVEIVAGDPYFAGKQMARLARLSLIAEELGELEMAENYRSKLQPVLNSWLEATNSDPLLYDSSWGGIVSTLGINDSQGDFGQGYYNDHHFHYGYHVYAAAVMAHSDVAWATEHNDEVLAIIRDILEPSGVDPFFPQTRHKDW